MKKNDVSDRNEEKSPITIFLKIEKKEQEQR
jgi:hypothetical protein